MKLLTERMRQLTELIQEDMKPAFGVTEPAAIAYGTAYACHLCEGEIQSVSIQLNSGMYKNAYSCGIPHMSEYGTRYAAALGVALKDRQDAIDSGLKILKNVSEWEKNLARSLVEHNMIRVTNVSFSSDIFIQAVAKSIRDTCKVLIRHEHTNVVRVEKNGYTVWEKEICEQPDKNSGIHNYSFTELWDYVNRVPIQKLCFIEDAFVLNSELAQISIHSDRTYYTASLYRKNGGKVISSDELTTAQLLCSGAIEGRVLGLDAAAMSITGSGSHGLICTMPLYAVSLIEGIPRERLLRATALSYLITIYIKEYSGRLSAFCGCGIAAGTGMACGLAFLRGGDLAAIHRTISNMASGITGMICDGGNHGCTMKSITAVDAAFRAVDFAMDGIGMEDVHGICGKTPEETCRNIGRIASPGMEECEKTILQIMEEK